MKLLKPLLFLLISSCANVPNVPICIEKSMDHGTCVYTMTGKMIEVDETNKFEEKTWYEQRNEMLKMPVSSWVEIKKFIIKTCKKYNCNKDVASWDRTIESVDSLSSEVEDNGE